MGIYLVYFDTTQDGNGADIDVGKHPITVADPFKPEFRLDIRAVDRNNTISGNYEFYAWDGSEWQATMLIGGAAIQNGFSSILEIQIPWSLLRKPEFINLGVVSTGRGRIHTAGDVLGTDDSPGDWEELVGLDVFAQYVIAKAR